jgi:hypothetical protein
MSVHAKQATNSKLNQGEPARPPTSSRARPSRKAKPAPARKTRAQHQSKQDRVVAMLRRRDGTTIAAVVKATGWQKHSVHGFFAGVVRKKLGLNLLSDESHGQRVYRIAAGKGGKAPRKSSRRQAG